jgi:hypothetical protein
MELMQIADDLVKAFHVCWKQLDESRLETMHKVLPTVFGQAGNYVKKIQAQVQSGDQSTRAMRRLVNIRDKLLELFLVAEVWAQQLSMWNNEMSVQVEALFEFVKDQLFLSGSDFASAKNLTSICVFELQPDRREDAIKFLSLFFSNVNYNLYQLIFNDPLSRHLPEPTIMRLVNLSTLPNGQQKTLWQHLLDLRERELLLDGPSSELAERIQNTTTFSHLLALSVVNVSGFSLNEVC